MRDTEFGDRAVRRQFGFRKKMIFIPFLVAGGLALFSYIVMLLWNALIPAIFHLGVITFWQAAGLLVLCKILFGFGRGGHRGGPWMRNRMERFKNMSPEERQKFKDQMRSRCGKWDRHPIFEEWEKSPGEAPKSSEGESKPAI